MAKLRKRLESRHKAKRWIKGHSSSSNPNFKGYRDGIHPGLICHHSGTSKLTVDALENHNAIQNGMEFPVADIEDPDEEKLSHRSSDTFASDWSRCSNISFTGFLNNFQSSSVAHKNMLSILAAVSDVIKQNGGTESSTEYYLGLVMTLEAADTEESIAAALSLLNIGMGAVPKNILNYHYTRTIRVFLKILENYASEGHFPILRHCIGCLSMLLRVQELTAWSDPWTKHVLDAILSFITHTKPRLRKTSQRALLRLLEGSDIMEGPNAPDFHPASSRIADFCLTQLNDTEQTGKLANTLHTLNLIRNTAGHFPRSSLKILCEKLLSTMSSNNLLLSSCCLQTLHGLMMSRPKEQALPPQLNAQIINALYDHQPPLGDTQPTLAWLAVMQEAHCNLVIHSAELCGANILRIVAKCIELWLSERVEIINGSSHTLRVILEWCIPPLCESAELVQRFMPILKGIVNLIQRGMEYRYISAWHHVLELLTVAIKVMGVHCQEEFRMILDALADLRNSQDLIYNSEIDSAIGSAVHFLGPEIVLSQIPLQATGGTGVDLRRSWLLPVLKDNISHSPLELFMNSFLPLADHCGEESLKLRGANDAIGAHRNELLQLQIWSLLPSFCHNPPDIQKSFKRIAKRLGVTMCEKKDLRIVIMASLRKLIQRSMQENRIGDINELSHYSKNFLPILFNIYTTKPIGSDEEGQRLASLETIKTLLCITSGELIVDLLDKALANFSIADATDFFKDSIFDLIRTLCQCADLSRLQIVSNRFIPLLGNTQRPRDQKKAYRFLEEICKSDGAVCKEFIHQNREQIKNAIIDTSGSIQNMSKGARIRCIMYLVRGESVSPNSRFLRLAIPEALTYLKESNERCRNSAFTLLNIIAEKLIDNKNSFEEYITMIMSGLDGPSSLQRSSSLLALTCIIYHFNGSLGVEKIHQILERVCSFITNDTRDTVSPALSFIKVYLSVVPTPMTASKLSSVMMALIHMTDDCQRHFRRVVRDILAKLTRKFGAETVRAMVPSSEIVLLKRLKNIQRIEVRKQRVNRLPNRVCKNVMDQERSRKKAFKSIEEILADSDDDCSAADDTDIDGIPKLKTDERWIRENSNNIIDFIDPASTTNITTTNSTHNGKQQSRHGLEFRLASDGRMIISEDAIDCTSLDKEIQSRGRKRQLSSSSDKIGDELVVSTALLERQRLNSEKNTPDAECLAERHTDSGSGIHRFWRGHIHRRKLGEEYRARRALGDVKLRGKLDPYAYVPLSCIRKKKGRKRTAALKDLLSRSKQGKRSWK